MGCEEDRGIGLAWSLAQEANRLPRTDVPGKSVVARAARGLPKKWKTGKRNGTNGGHSNSKVREVKTLESGTKCI